MGERKREWGSLVKIYMEYVWPIELRLKLIYDNTIIILIIFD
jgi:hypothetical protein